MFTQLQQHNNTDNRGWGLNLNPYIKRGGLYEL